MGNKVRESVESSIVDCARKQARITKISSNPVLAAIEIRMAREEIRRLHCELARVVLFDAMEKDGAIFPEGTEGGRNPLDSCVFRSCGTFFSGITIPVPP